MDMGLGKLQAWVMDREAWRAAGHGVIRNQARMSDWKTTTSILHMVMDMFPCYPVFPPPCLSPTVCSPRLAGRFLTTEPLGKALMVHSKCSRTDYFRNLCWRQRWLYFKSLMWPTTALIEADMSDCPASLLNVQDGRVMIINDKSQVDGKQKQVKSMASQWEDQHNTKQLLGRAEGRGEIDGLGQWASYKKSLRRRAECTRNSKCVLRGKHPE